MAEAINSQIEAAQDKSATDERYLIFRVVDDELGIAIDYVIEIISMQSITMVPELPGYMIGVINLRGTIIPVMDARLRFSQPAAEYDERTCIIVIQLNDTQLGLVVDTVEEVLIISDDKIVDPPNSERGSSGASQYVKGIVKLPSGIKQIVDCQAIFGYSEDMG